MSELKKEILNTLLMVTDVQEMHCELMQQLADRVEEVEKDLTMAKRLQKDLDENLSAVVKISEKLL